MAGERRGRWKRDRRKHSGEFRTKPPPSPGSMVVLLVSAVLLLSAAAAALLGGGFGSETPHGRLLTTLEAVAVAQEAHHRETGRFAGWQQTVEVDMPDDVELQLVAGDSGEWRALASAPDVGLSCSLGGSVSGDSFLREQPVCYRDETLGRSGPRR